MGLYKIRILSKFNDVFTELMASDTLKESKLTLAITFTSLTKSEDLNLYLGFDRNYSITSVQIMFYDLISIVFF